MVRVFRGFLLLEYNLKQKHASYVEFMYMCKCFTNRTFLMSLLFFLSLSLLLMSIVLYKYKDQGSFRLLTTNRHGHRHQVVYFSSLLFFSFSIVFCVYSYPTVLFYPNHRIIQEKEGKKRHLNIVLNMRRREEKKNHHKFGGRSLSVHILRYLFCIYIGLLVRGGDESIAKKKREWYGRKRRKRKMASSSFIVDRWSSRPGEKYN
jgi:hypothetical protein